MSVRRGPWQESARDALADIANEDVKAALGKPEIVALEEQLYGHVIEAIDFDALFGFEQMLWFLLDKLGLGSLDDEVGLAKVILRRAMVRATFDPGTAFSDVPYGITKEEAKAVAFDPECPFCRYEAERPPAEAADAHEDDCPCCAELARSWRHDHAEALRRRTAS